MLKTKSILHIGNTAGQSQILSKFQRIMGFKSDVLSLDQHSFGYTSDFLFRTKMPYPLSKIDKALFILRIMNKYEVLHFHFNSILPFGLDFPIWKMLRKKVIMHHRGSDIRYRGEKWMYSRFAAKILVSTPDLLRWSPSAIWVPNPVDLDKYHYVGVKETEKINIVHAPSSRAIKGTEYVINAVKKLENEGYKVNLMLVENVPYNKVIEYYKQADIVVDQLLLGWYGNVTIECMALGKPVCVFINKDLESYVQFMPVLNTSPENLVENLKMLIEDKELRGELGEKGRKYVENVHDPIKVNRKLIELYEV